MRQSGKRNLVEALSLLVLWSLLGAAGAPAQEKNLRILVTDGDGIESPGLHALVKELSTVAEVVVAAPAGDRSEDSQSLSLRAGMLRTQGREIDGATAAWAVEGTVSDAVVFGLLALGSERPFDLVLSGISRGNSLGELARASGTVGGALEAAAWGVPAIAASQDQRLLDYSVASRFLTDLAVQVREKGLPTGTALVVNIPAAATEKSQPAAISRMGEAAASPIGFSRVETEGGDDTLWRVQWKRERRPSEGSDLDNYQRGQVTITPLGADWTKDEAMETLRDWDLQVRVE